MKLSAGQPKQALQLYRRIEHQDPEFLVEAIVPIKECFQSLNQAEEFGDYIRYLSQQYGGVTPVLALSDLIEKEQGAARAISFLSQELRKRPSLRGLDRLIGYALQNADGPAKQHMMMFKDVTNRWVQRKPGYKCRHCGFMAKTLHWQCPSCKYWNTVKPLQGIDGE